MKGHAERFRRMQKRNWETAIAAKEVKMRLLGFSDEQIRPQYHFDRNQTPTRASEIFKNGVVLPRYGSNKPRGGTSPLIDPEPAPTQPSDPNKPFYPFKTSADRARERGTHILISFKDFGN